VLLLLLLLVLLKHRLARKLRVTTQRRVTEHINLL
jgi:hypothetical protein